MTELRMTPKRLELLQAVGDGAVTLHDRWRSTQPSYSQLDLGPAAESRRWVRVTARVEELRDAGMVRPGRREGISIMAPQLWELTPSGEARLAGARAAEAALKSALASHRDVTG